VSANPRELAGAFSRVIGRQGGNMDLSALLPERMVIEAREGRRLRKALASVSETAFAAAVQTLAAGVGSGGGRTAFRTQGAIAILDVRGVLSKEFSLWGLIFGGQACTEHVLAMLNAALADPEVKRVLVVFDTPGGDVRGIDELAEALFLARKVKPIIGFGSDRCMSGGFWLASQCEKLYLSANCWTGSIGVRISIEDDERAELNAGIDRKEFGSTAAKLNAPDTALQQATDDLAANFVAAVARGRGISPAEAQKLADALPYIGQRAVDRGLADGVTTLQTLVGQLQEETAAAPPVTVEIWPPSEDDETETTRAEAPAIEPRAEGEGHLTAQQEDPMAEITQAQLDKALADVSAKFETKVTALGNDVAALAKENADLKTKVTDVSGNVVTMTTKQQTLDLLAKARADVKLTKGNEEILEPAIRAMAEMNIEKAKVFVDTLPKLGKGEGRVLHAVGAAGTGTGLPPRHRFDAYGPAAWSKSTDPAMAGYAEKIQWIAAHDGVDGHPKFRNVTEAFQAFHAANVDQTRVA
jgi:ClpP class serine protease